MNRFLSVISLLVLGAIPAYAQDFSVDAFNRDAFVSDLNILAELQAKDELTNADISAIAAIGCATVRKIDADNLLENTANWFEVQGFPDAEALQTIDIEAFVSFELSEFEKAGVTPAAIDLAERVFFGLESLPKEAPFINKDLLTESEVEARFCSARQLDGADPNAPANEAQIVLASAATDVIVGSTTIVIDAWVSVASGGVGAVAFGMISGGVGWDLMKKGFGW